MQARLPRPAITSMRAQRRRSGCLGLVLAWHRPPKTRASCPAGACSTPAIRVAGGLQHPQQPGAQRSSDGSSASALTPAASSVWVPSAPPSTHELLVGLGELDGRLRHCHRVARPRERGRSLQQRRDAVESGPIQGEDGQPVLRDLEGRPRRPHPAPQIRHFGHGQPVVRVTTTIDVSANTAASEATNSRFSVRSKSRLRRWPRRVWTAPAGLPMGRRREHAPGRPGSPVLSAGTDRTRRPEPRIGAVTWLPRLPRAGLAAP